MRKRNRELESRRERETAAGLWRIGLALTVAGVGAVVGLAALTVAAFAVLGFPHLAPLAALSVGDLLEVLKLVLGTVAGVGALAALVMNYRKQRVAEAGEVREQTRVFNERFATAAGQMGHDEPAVRLAGVYAMAGLADDWEHGRQTCIDVLCAYLRMPYEAAPSPDAPDADRLAYGRNQQVRHTIINVITAHLINDARVSWQSNDFDFRGTRFDGGDFTGAKFAGDRTEFDRAEFAYGEVYLCDVEFASYVSFSSAKFVGGSVYFDQVDFAGEAYFQGAEFAAGEVTFIGTKFTRGTVDFTHAKFSGSAVTFTSAEFIGSAVAFTSSQFSDGIVAFHSAKFIDGSVAFYNTQFIGGQVTFNQAEFAGDVVKFWMANFAGGIVDLSTPRSWAVQPKFSLAIPNPDRKRPERNLSAPPSGLLLPPNVTIDRSMC